MSFISLVDEIQFMLISSRHICIRSIGVQYFIIIFTRLLRMIGIIHSTKY